MSTPGDLPEQALGAPEAPEAQHDALQPVGERRLGGVPSTAWVGTGRSAGPARGGPVGAHHPLLVTAEQHDYEVTGTTGVLRPHRSVNRIVTGHVDRCGEWRICGELPSPRPDRRHTRSPDPAAPPPGRGPPTPPPARSGPPPAAAEPPPSIRTAVRLMYVGAGLGLIGLLSTFFQIDAIRDQIEDDDPRSASEVDTAVAIGVVSAVVIGLMAVGLWLWMAHANGRGQSWARWSPPSSAASTS